MYDRSETQAPGTYESYDPNGLKRAQEQRAQALYAGSKGDPQRAPTMPSDVQPNNGLLNLMAADIADLTTAAWQARAILCELRARVLGPWPEDACATTDAREPSSQAELLAQTVGVLRRQLLEIRDHAAILNRAI